MTWVPNRLALMSRMEAIWADEEETEAQIALHTRVLRHSRCPVFRPSVGSPWEDTLRGGARNVHARM